MNNDLERPVEGESGFYMTRFETFKRLSPQLGVPLGVARELLEGVELERYLQNKQWAVVDVREGAFTVLYKHDGAFYAFVYGESLV